MRTDGNLPDADPLADLLPAHVRAEADPAALRWLERLLRDGEKAESNNKNTADRATRPGRGA